MSAPRAVLLDTCAMIWLANDLPLARSAMLAIVAAGLSEGIFVSTTSAWETGFLSRPMPGCPRQVECRPDAKTWFARFLAGPGVREAAITPAIVIDASYLPGDLHPDPADCLIIATARHMGVPIVTRDQKIIAYAAAGHVDVIPC